MFLFDLSVGCIVMPVGGDNDCLHDWVMESFIPLIRTKMLIFIQEQNKSLALSQMELYVFLVFL